MGAEISYLDGKNIIKKTILTDKMKVCFIQPNEGWKTKTKMNFGFYLPEILHGWEASKCGGVCGRQWRVQEKLGHDFGVVVHIGTNHPIGHWKENDDLTGLISPGSEQLLGCRVPKTRTNVEYLCTSYLNLQGINEHKKITLKLMEICLIYAFILYVAFSVHQGAALETVCNSSALPGRVCFNSVCQKVISWSTQSHSLAFFFAAKGEWTNFISLTFVSHTLQMWDFLWIADHPEMQPPHLRMLSSVGDYTVRC